MRALKTVLCVRSAAVLIGYASCGPDPSVIFKISRGDQEEADLGYSSGKSAERT